MYRRIRIRGGVFIRFMLMSFDAEFGTCLVEILFINTLKALRETPVH